MIPHYTLRASFHVTTRCNNREFNLIRLECRQVLIYALKRAIAKFQFRLYGLCIMSNHVHYLIEPQNSDDLAKIMHWINWYAAMCFNRMLHRTGHFWEKRYYATGFDSSDYQRALNTLRYIHANPKAANMQQGFFYDFSNYGVHDRLSDDGLTSWHPAFLALGKTLEDCAKKYRGFCQKYKPKEKTERKYYWGTKLLPKIIKGKGKSRKVSPGQLKLPWAQWRDDNPEITAVADRFVFANCFDPKSAGEKMRQKP